MSSIRNCAMSAEYDAFNNLSKRKKLVTVKELVKIFAFFVL